MAILLGSLSGGMQPSAPTIGTATAGDTSASVAFTASSYIGKGTITYTATSSPGGLTATGASSPLTVTGLTNGTAYTFTVVGTTNYGVASNASAASNSITPAAQGSFESIATVSVGSGGASSITFSSIPQTYQHLQIRLIAQTNRATFPSDVVVLYSINGSTSNIGYNNNIWAMTTGFNVTSDSDGYRMMWIMSNVTYNQAFGVGVIDVLNYSSTSVNKSFYAQGGMDNNGAGANPGIVSVAGNLYRSTSAISSFSLEPGEGSLFLEHSKFALYGIKGS